MSESLGWGIIGTGGIAAMQTKDLRLAGLRVAAVGSRNAETAEAFGGKFGISNRHGSYEALVSDPSVDIVYVATPHPMHCENALLAIEAGKHVLVEKAFTMNADEARQIAEAATKRNCFVMEAMWTRFLPTMDRVMELIRTGAIGEPRVLLADHNQYIPHEKAPRVHEPELGGGSVLDLGIYPYSFASRIFGRPKAIAAHGTLSKLGLDELTSTVFEYESGAQAVSQIGFLTPGPNQASVIGHEGRIDIDRVWYTQTSFTHYDQGGNVVERYDEKIEGRGMQYQAREVERCVREGISESPVMPLSETIELMETMDEILRQIGVTYPIAPD